MGSKLCKGTGQSSPGRRQEENSNDKSNSSNGGDPGVKPEADLSSYEDACRADPQLRSLDATIHQRTSRAMNSIAVNLDIGALSIDSLRDVTEALLDMNQDVVSIILQSKKDIWKNPELSDLVDEYFKNSLQSLDFCAALEACLQRALNSQSRINLALTKFEREHTSSDGSSNLYSKTLEELRNFKDAGQPFTEEFFSLFHALYKQQLLMLEKLQVKKRKLDRKLGKLKTWRKVTNVIFVAAFVSVLICSVVAAAVTAPPVVTALTAAAAVPLGSMGKWLNSIWTKWERELKGQRDIIFSMQIGSYVVIKDLENIRVLVDKLQIEIEALIQNAEFAMREDEAVVIAVNDIKKKVDGFTKTIQDLSEHADKCSRDINRTRTMILRRIIDHPSRSNNGGIGMIFS
ncbi:hypothetical protein M9H77_15682 [Catharanthus roseus]|uniref:Uncharacterized protein n=1 Tax=Catharanthus roseus TaxID=4058 RepID=A0ACC0AY77_CATRO|nr:hypothetical protein M9H77_15682 [Catharanthus roseus]